MALFDRKSRYVDPKRPPYKTRDWRGREVLAVQVPDAPQQVSVGEHIRKEGQRLDHLAHAYLEDANGFWRIAEHNDVMLPEALSEAETIKIPAKTR